MEQTAELDQLDRTREKATRRSGHRFMHVYGRVVQACGPVRPLGLPKGHSRQSILIPLRNALQAAEKIDVANHARLGGVIHTSIGELVDDLEPAVLVHDPDDEDEAMLPALAWFPS